MSEHSILPPSSAARRLACPGSRALEALFPQEESAAAREGTAAHWVASQMLLLRDRHGKPPSQWSTAPNGEPVTQEMIEGAELYNKCVMDVLKMYSNPHILQSLHVEERINITTIHPECWGTPDAWLYNKNVTGNAQLYIWDYKYGHGIVEVFENWQLLEYAAGILQTLGVNGYDDQHTSVTFYIVQPRGYHRDGTIRSWTTKACDLRAQFNALRDAETKAMEPNAPCRPSPECTYCAGRHACQTLQRSALSAVDVSLSNTPDILTGDHIGNELRYLTRAAELLEARITGLSEQALSIIKSGQRVPHYRAEQSTGRECWNRNADEVALLGDMFGIDLKKPVAVITPKQAVKEGIPQEVIKQYSVTPRGAIKLVAEDSTQIRKIFGTNK